MSSHPQSLPEKEVVAKVVLHISGAKYTASDRGAAHNAVLHSENSQIAISQSEHYPIILPLYTASGLHSKSFLLCFGIN